MMRFQKYNSANLIGGLLFAAIGLAASLIAMTYPLGQLNRMGPGYVPLALGIVLTALGVGIIFQSRGEAEPLPTIQMRALLTISGAVIGFGLVAAYFGLIPAAFVVIILSSLADRRFRPIAAILTAVGVSLFSYFVLIEGLGVSMRAFHWG